MSQPPYPLPPGRDPRAPFGAAPPSVSIDAYAPPRPKASLVIAIVVAVAALAAALFVLTGPTDAPPADPAARPSSSETPSWGQPFAAENDSVTGQWQIVSHEWTPFGLHVQVRIAVENGPLEPTFVMFSNDAAETVEPLPTPDSPGFTEPLNSGDDKTSWLTFPIGRGAATLMLGDSWSRQLSALGIEG